MNLIKPKLKKAVPLLALAASAAACSTANASGVQEASAVSAASDAEKPVWTTVRMLGCENDVQLNMNSIPGSGKWEERPFRLPDVNPENYTEEQKEAAHDMYCELGVKQLAGPHRAYIRDPRIFNAMTELIKAENNSRAIPPRLIRLIAITYSQMWKAQFEWYIQSSIAVRDGISPDVVAAIAAGETPTFTRNDERLVYTAIKEMEETKALSDETFKALRKEIGDDGFVEFLAASGTFMTVGMQVKALEMKAPGPGPANPLQ